MTRAYRSSLRAAQAEETRHRILAAMAEQLAEGPAEFSLPRVAQRAGVALRTIHHHFPDAEARIAGLAEWIDAQSGIAEAGPDSADDMAPYARRMAEAFFRNERLMRAQLAPGVAERVRGRRRRRREQRLRKGVEALVPDPRAAASAAAMFAWLISADTAVALADRHGLERGEVARAMEWAARALVAAIRAGDAP